jgi:hypothetical protein
MPLKLNWDMMGIVTSVACAVHCALLPVLVGSLPLLGVDLVRNPFFEWAMIGLAFGVGAYSLFHGYRTHHRSLAPVLLFLLGFLFLVLKQFFHSSHLALLFSAVALMIAAHYINFTLCRKSRCTSHHHRH